MILSSKPLKPARDSTWVLHIDGATYGTNPSAIGSAGVTVWVNGLLYLAFTKQKIVATNNNTEFFALLQALKWAHSKMMHSVTIYSDSDLVCKWAANKSLLKDPKLIRLAAACHHYRQFLSFEVIWVPRNEERQALTDYVSKLGLTEEIEFKTEKQHRFLLETYYSCKQMKLPL